MSEFEELKNSVEFCYSNILSFLDSDNESQININDLNSLVGEIESLIQDIASQANIWDLPTRKQSRDYLTDIRTRLAVAQTRIAEISNNTTISQTANDSSDVESLLIPQEPTGSLNYTRPNCFWTFIYVLLIVIMISSLVFIALELWM